MIGTCDINFKNDKGQNAPMQKHKKFVQGCLAQASPCPPVVLIASHGLPQRAPLI